MPLLPDKSSSLSKSGKASGNRPPPAGLGTHTVQSDNRVTAQTSRILPKRSNELSAFATANECGGLTVESHRNRPLEPKASDDIASFLSLKTIHKQRSPVYRAGQERC